MTLYPVVLRFRIVSSIADRFSAPATLWRHAKIVNQR
jgi:hypothetical protein